MFRRKCTIIATIFIAFMYLVPVSVFAAGNGTLVVITQDSSKKQIAAPIYVDNELMGTGKVTLTLPAKKHKVKFGDVEGYAIVSPRSGKKNVLVKAGKTTTVKGTYQAATGTHTASGTYTWNSTKGEITWNWTTSTFVCEGPDLGTETKKGVTVTSTTMTWTIDDDMTWTRSSGTAGDIVGTWTASDSTTGNSWTLTFNADGTVSATGNIVKCGEDGGGDSPSAHAQVVNNSGDSIYQVNVGDTIFTLTGRGSSGGSTGFSDVAEGTNTITVKQTSTSASVSVGSLGSFQKDTGYAVNIRKVSGSYCAELWQRLNADSSFNDDTTRVLISTTCEDGGGGSSNPSGVTIYTSPDSFNSAAASLGTATVVNFESATACTGDTIQGCTAFDGSFYSSNGITFSNPNGYPLYIAPAGLAWNSSKSLSIGRFPGDPLSPAAPEYEDDDLVMTFSTPVRAVGFDVIDSTSPTIEFKDSNGNIIATTGLSSEYTSYRTFIGIVSTNSTIKEVNIIDAGNDGDDVNYDDVTFYP